eukprot:CAMPEP_0114527256 /NCGR_PEP_ID=MMETSP0109-20121206/23509_1 /TAXON_ID=29199 /ORGANISM="Chlorarachnion reptans, Strain CCCM449" /LENGTH=567 /DNA_ID=CAMNT_0001709189 /DNA_START=1 /DNA_END=1704 /DNA_ORIENTATION=+
MSGNEGEVKQLSVEEVARHNREGDAWIVVDEKVYDVSDFLDAHPGGRLVILKEAGKDASEIFHRYHNESLLRKYDSRLLVGYIEDSKAAKEALRALKPTYEQDKKRFELKSIKAIQRTLDSMFGPAPKPDPKVLVRLPLFGAKIPYGEPSWYQLYNSSYFKETHIQWRSKCRAAFEKHVIPFTHEWEENYGPPGHEDHGYKPILKKLANEGLLPGFVGLPWPSKYTTAEGPEAFDGFHLMIIADELARCGSGGVLWGLVGGLGIGLPPILHFGSEEMKKRVIPGCLNGEKVICLAITEPWAGSDVAGLSTTAEKSKCGKYYIVNGSKKWITNGIWADYFTVAVRTGGPGPKGISMLLIEKDMEGVSTRHMKCMGVWASGTTYINFENVKVPVGNLIGEENKGFKVIMYNFNNERLGMVMCMCRFARVCYEEAFKHAYRRKTFGKPLIKHQSIRMKLAKMIQKIESTQRWMENMVFQMNTMSRKEQNLKLGGAICLLKAHASQVFEFCAREAAQIFGGASYVRGGIGEKVERMYRDVRAFAIPGGSEEIMMDFGVRDATVKYERFSKM